MDHDSISSGHTKSKDLTLKCDCELAKKFLATGDRYLEETNWWGDKVWGVYRGQGHNLTGKVLMDIRARLAKERAAAPGKAK